MILAPSKLFMDYIADVLPELGVGQICQTTYAEYVLNATGLKLKLTDPDAKLAQLAQSATLDEDKLFVTRVKGTLDYREILQRYVIKLEQDMAELFEDVFIEKYRIMKASQLKKPFLQDFSYMPVEKGWSVLKSLCKAM